jgi:hypothetical protein
VKSRHDLGRPSEGTCGERSYFADSHVGDFEGKSRMRTRRDPSRRARGEISTVDSQGREVKEGSRENS